MFEQLFRHAGTVEQYRTAPLADCRLRYLTHWLKLGAARSTLRRIAGNQVEVVRLLDLQRTAARSILSRLKPQPRGGRCHASGAATRPSRQP